MAAKDAPAAPPAEEIPWHSLSVEQALLQLQSSEAGLTSTEVATRLTTYGENSLTAKERPGFFRKLWAQINNVLIYILIAAAIVSGAFKDWIELGLIVLVVFVNVTIGMIQEGKAEKAADALKSMLAPKCTVVRDGGVKATIDAIGLVPGDIIFLQSGDCLPADARVLTCSAFSTLESMLTGESMPVAKKSAPVAPDAALADRKCMVFSGTLCMTGTATALVVATGDSSKLGVINALVNGEEEKATHLQAQLEVFGRFISVFTILVGISALLMGRFYVGDTWNAAILAAIAVAVAIIPEGLPAVVTITLALGMQRMAAHKAIIRKLPAVETLGSVTVICSDKTGTLTQNQMTAVGVVTAAGSYRVTGGGYDPTNGSLLTGEAEDAPPMAPPQLAKLRALLLTGLLANDGGLTQTDGTWVIAGDPTDAAPLVLARKAGVPDHVAEQARYKRVGAIPFESEHKYAATLNTHPDTGKRVLHVKGAFERLLPLCSQQVVDDDVATTAPVNTAFWHAAALRMASRGLRVLAYCSWDAPSDFDAHEHMSPAALAARGAFLTLQCLVAIQDPPRPECKGAIAEAHTAGIVVKMITGDSPDTARSIAHQLGIVTTPDAEAITGPELDKLVAQGDPKLVQAAAMRCNVFARVSPENKIAIVKALQEAGQIASMTGDGVNDAPALKAASIGVAMGITGTDVSKEAAKIVLADDNFVSIVTAVKEGRRVWANLVKTLLLNIPANLAQGLSVFFAFALKLPNAPLTPVAVLYVNMIVGVCAGLAIAFEPAEEDTMTRPPRRPKKSIMGKRFFSRCVWVTAAHVCLIIGMFQWSLDNGYDLARSRAIAFNMLVWGTMAYALSCRFVSKSSLHPRVFRGNTTLWASLLFMGVMQFIITYVPGLNTTVFGIGPMGGEEWARVFGFSIVLFLVVELEKRVSPFLTRHVTRPLLVRLGWHAHPVDTEHVRFLATNPNYYGQRALTSGTGKSMRGVHLTSVPPASTH